MFKCDKDDWLNGFFTGMLMGGCYEYQGAGLPRPWNWLFPIIVIGVVIGILLLLQ